MEAFSQAMFNCLTLLRKLRTFSAFLLYHACCSAFWRVCDTQIQQLHCLTKIFLGGLFDFFDWRGLRES